MPLPEPEEGGAVILYLVAATLGLRLPQTLMEPEHRIVADEHPVLRTGDTCPLCGGKRYLRSIGFGAIDRPCPRCTGEKS